MIKESIGIPIYNRRLHMVITGDFNKDYPEINKIFNQEFTENDNVLGITQDNKGHYLIIINVGKHRKIFKKYQIEISIADTIAHESVHVCNLLFEDIGAIVDQNNDEPQAYLVGWIVGQLTKNYLKLKQKEIV